MWCPNCRNEYRKGISECADCHISLVEYDELPPEHNAEAAGFVDADFVKWAGEHSDELMQIKDKVNSAPVEGIYEGLYADNSNSELSEDEAFIQNITNDYCCEKTASVMPYKSKQEKAEEYKSSAYTMFLVGGIGLIFILLSLSGIIPVKFGGNTFYLSYGVMGTLFVIFLITGFRSYGSAGKYAIEAQKENDLEKEIKNWFSSSFSRENIDTLAFDGDIDRFEDIEIYYKRHNNILEKIIDKYPSADPAFADKIAEDLFHDIFE